MSADCCLLGPSSFSEKRKRERETAGGWEGCGERNESPFQLENDDNSSCWREGGKTWWIDRRRKMSVSELLHEI
jgi:hypothetical protein